MQRSILREHVQWHPLLVTTFIGYFFRLLDMGLRNALWNFITQLLLCHHSRAERGGGLHLGVHLSKRLVHFEPFSFGVKQGYTCFLGLLSITIHSCCVGNMSSSIPWIWTDCT